MQSSYDASEWESRTLFVPLLQEACDHIGVRLTWFSQKWIARFERDGVVRFLSGYTFALNDAASADCMRDKVTTATILQAAEVPAIPHALMRLSAMRELPSVADILALAPLPLVLKPAAAESGGLDVMRCTTEAEVAAALTSLASRYRSIAVCPYIDIARELRVVMLDGKAKVVFEKIRKPGEWRHNLKLGATPHVVDDPAAVALAQRAMTALGGRIASVDIAETPDSYQIMEINGGITLDRFSAHSPEYRTTAVEIYAAIIDASLRT